MKQLFYLLPFFLLACSPSNKEYDRSIPEGQYAQGFLITEHETYTEVIIFDPWEAGAVMQKYILVQTGQEFIPENTDAVIVRTPIKRLAATSCTHVGFLDALGETGSLCGICSPSMVYTPIVGVDEGCIDLGDAMQVNIEKVLLAHPDAIMLSTYSKTDVVRQQLQKSDIPIIYNNEWTEQSPLARAEWIKLIGLLYNKKHEADSIFEEVEKVYTTLRNKVADEVKNKRTIMAGSNFRGTWYMPSGKVYTGRLYKDAGAVYFYENDLTDGSIPLSFETVLLNFREADVWVNCTARTMEELRAMDDKHSWFKAYQTREIYNFLKRTTATGANDFWESGVVHPERLLQDLVWTIYPTMLPDYEPYYTLHLE